MPMTGWTGRLHMIGGGAYVSNISYEEMIPRLNDGEVAVGTDTGHSGTDLIFGWGHRDRIIDFGYRAVHETTVAAKRSEEHTSELQSLMRISYAVFCLKKQTTSGTSTLNPTINYRIQS